MDVEMVSGVGFGNAFSFPFFNPDVDADAPDVGGPPILGLITLLPLNVLK